MKDRKFDDSLSQQEEAGGGIGSQGRRTSRRPQAVGLREVAARAGTAIATASAALHNTQSTTRFSAATRERVLAAAKELNYHPNALARALTGRLTKSLGVMFGHERASVAVANPYVFGVLQGIISAASDAAYNVVLLTEPWYNAERSQGILMDGRTDGVVLIAVATDSDVLSTLANAGVPAVAVSSRCEEYGVPSVDIDNCAGARMATNHLLDLGHRRIAHLGGDMNLTDAQERIEAFELTMADAGIPVKPEYLPPGVFGAKSGYERALRLLELPYRPTAIFAANDEMAFATIEAAQSRGLDVPGDLSVVGFDDISVPDNVSPWLTTIRQPLNEIGVTGATMLIALLNGEDLGPKTRIITPELIVRQSTAPPNTTRIRQ